MLIGMMSPGFALALLALIPVARRVLEYQEEVEQALNNGHRPTREQLQRMRYLYDMTEEQVELCRQGLDWGMTPEQQQRSAERLRSEMPQPPTVQRPSQEELEQRELTRKVREYYAAVDRQKWRGIPAEMRGGLRMDRWGTLWVKNPHGAGWREQGSDGPYDVKPSSSW